MVTKVTAVAPGGDCPRWQDFLLEIVQGDPELAAYIQRWAGYMLTGETREHAFLCVSGPGGNGKSLLVNTLARVLGDYAATAPMETFMATTGDRHPTDLAGLRGARLVMAQETEAGRALAEAKIKTLTGGDPVSARFMRGNFFEYVPAFKLVLVGNHRPVIRNPDDALRRRLHLLPLTFKPARPDVALEHALRAEAAGILRWAVDGCLEWQAKGLGMPAAVKAATGDYFADQDLPAQWLAERCVAEARSSAPSSALFRDWTAWCAERSEQPWDIKWFSAVVERHYAKERARTGMVFRGVRLLPSAEGAL
jgi:putative DNA primase/helicase